MAEKACNGILYCRRRSTLFFKKYKLNNVVEILIKINLANCSKRGKNHYSLYVRRDNSTVLVQYCTSLLRCTVKKNSAKGYNRRKHHQFYEVPFCRQTQSTQFGVFFNLILAPDKCYSYARYSR